MGDHVVKRVQKLQTQVELSDVVTVSVVDREVIPMNYGPECFCHRLMSGTTQDGVSLIRYM